MCKDKVPLKGHKKGRTTLQNGQFVPQRGVAKNCQPICICVQALGWLVSPLYNGLWKTVLRAVFHLFTRKSTLRSSKWQQALKLFIVSLDITNEHFYRHLKVKKVTGLAVTFGEDILDLIQKASSVLQTKQPLNMCKRGGLTTQVKTLRSTNI